MTERKERVLVVEDLPESRRTFSRDMTLAGYSVDTAGSLEEALNRVENKTYHVAVIDLSLDPNDRDNRDGMKIIRRIHELNEGTKCIILTSFEDLDVAIEGYEELGLVKYLKKIGGPPSRDLVSVVDEASQKARINELGEYPSLLLLLAGEKESAVLWIDLALRTLKPSNGLAGLDTFLSGLCRGLTPLHPRKEGIPTEIDEEQKCLHGDFWSKSLGKAVSILAYPEVLGGRILAEGKLVIAKEENLLRKHEKAKLIGFVHILEEADRSEFVERI